MQRWRDRLIAAFLVSGGLASPAAAQLEWEATPSDVAKRRGNWPRLFERNGNRLIVYQPQIDRWDKYETLSAGAAAVAVTTSTESVPDFGTIRFTAPTIVDVPTHSVQLGRRVMAGMKFPELESSRYLEVRGIVEGLLPEAEPLVMSLDEIIAYLDLEQFEPGRRPIDLVPPPIFWSREPGTILVSFTGAPEWKVIESSTLKLAVNADAPVVLDPDEGRYYLLRDEGSLTTENLDEGPWAPATKLPAGIADTAPTSNRRAKVPRIIVSFEPAMLITTDGPPELEPIPPTRIASIGNTEPDLFLYTGDFQYYLLIGESWFRASGLDGPWLPASLDLPSDFRNIPPDHPRGHVLAAVPGSPEEKAAALIASMPRTARIRRDEATVDVTYDGPPRFVPVQGSVGVLTAENTDFDVFSVEGGYYCCYQAVWFEAASPMGPWAVCERVPPAIYTIPELSPKWHVTDVQVGNVTPDYVEMRHSADYTEELVTLGLITAGVVYAFSQADSVNFSGHISLGGGTNVTWGSKPKPDPYRRWGRANLDDRSWADAGAPRGAGERARGQGRLTDRERGDVYAGPDGNVFRRGPDGSWQQRTRTGWEGMGPGGDSNRHSSLNRHHNSRTRGARNSGNFNRSRGNRARGGGRR